MQNAGAATNVQPLSEGSRERFLSYRGEAEATGLLPPRKVKAIHERDPAEAWGPVQVPDALDRKYPNAPMDWCRQWVFPQKNRWRNSKTGEEGRHHTDESLIQKAVKDAVTKAGLAKRATGYTFRHSFETHLLERG